MGGHGRERGQTAVPTIGRILACPRPAPLRSSCAPSSGLSCVQNPNHHLTLGTHPALELDPRCKSIWRLNSQNRKCKRNGKLRNLPSRQLWQIRCGVALPRRCPPQLGFESHKCRFSGCIRQMTQHQPDQRPWDISLATRQPGDTSTCKADLGAKFATRLSRSPGDKHKHRGNLIVQSVCGNGGGQTVSVAGWVHLCAGWWSAVLDPYPSGERLEFWGRHF